MYELFFSFLLLGPTLVGASTQEWKPVTAKFDCDRIYAELNVQVIDKS